MKDKITKQDIYTRLAIVEAKLDKLLDLIQGKKAMQELTSFSQELDLYDEHPLYTRPSGDLSIE